jgi:hypothetical protein
MIPVDVRTEHAPTPAPDSPRVARAAEAIAEENSAADPLDDAWRSLLVRWDDPGAHRAFVVLADSLGRLEHAARMYRQAREAGDGVIVGGYRVPGDLASRRERADRGLELVVAQALAHLAHAPRAERVAPRVKLIKIAALMMLVSGSFALTMTTGNRAFSSPAVLLIEVALVALIPWQRLWST